jgi:flagellar protein FliO/FliZ
VPELALTRSLMAASCGLLVLPATSLAANGESTPLNLGGSDAAKTAADHAAGGGGAMLRTIIGLIVVIAVIYCVTWVLKRVKGAKEAKATGEARVEPLATVPLGANKTLHLVRAGSEIVLLGAGEHGLTPIKTYTEEEARRSGLIPAGQELSETTPTAIVPGPGGLITAPARRRSWLDELRAKTVIK